MEMHQVRYFLAMAKELNFTRAADECNVSQPSLTRAVQKLEEEFGGALFRRERSRTHLTDLGRLMLPLLEQAFGAAQAAKQLAKGVGKAQVAPLSLGVATAARSPALDEVLRELGEGLPGFELSIRSDCSSALIEAALSGALDLVLVETPHETPDRFETWPLFEQSYAMIVRASHELSGRDDVDLARAAREVWIDCGSEGFARLRRAAEVAGLAIDARHHAADAEQLRQLVGAGLGAAYMPHSQRRPGLHAVLIRELPNGLPVVLAAIAGRRRSMAADAFVRAARARGWQAIAEQPLPD